MQNARIRNSKWDFRFLEAAKLVSTWSKDPSTKCGAVIVKSKGDGAPRIVSTGYNGFPRGTSDDAEIYAERELKYSRVVHAEMNAIVQAQESLYGASIYTYPPGLSASCDRCTAHIIQAGIKEVVHIFDNNSEFSIRWSEAATRANDMFDEAGVDVVQYPIEVWDDLDIASR